MRTRYDVGESIEDVRQAMELWGDEVERLVGNLSSKGGIDDAEIRLTVG